MTKRINAKYKIDRRLGVNLWGRPKSPVNNRSYGPGQHGQQRSKPSDYGIQLRAKQKLKGYYGNISERQFRRLYQEAIRRRGDTSENLIELLERRLCAPAGAGGPQRNLVSRNAAIRGGGLNESLRASAQYSRNTACSGTLSSNSPGAR